ncbi:MAG: B12-binding domain-containing radical SAM protein, partial [Candidatus Woesearchaeota archaeon]
MKGRNIVFVNPRVELGTDFFDNPAFCMTGMLYAASYVRSSGFDTEMIDSFVSADPEEVIKATKSHTIIGEKPESLVKKIEMKKPDMVIMNYSDFHREIRLMPGSLRYLLRRLKKPGRKLILSNFHMTECMKFFNFREEDIKRFAPEIDQVMNGYFQEEFPKILEESIVQGNEEKRHGFLDYNMFDMKRYHQFFIEMIRRGLIKENNSFDNLFPMFTSRGCNHRCFFCNSSKGRWIPFSLEDIESNIKSAKDMGTSKIIFLDLLANLEKKRFMHILNMINKIGLKAHFTNGLRIDQLNEDIIRGLSKCTDILSVSIESGVQDVLDNIIKKDMDLNKVEENARLISKYNINCYAHYMIRSPGEDEEDVKKTNKYAEKLHKLYGIRPRIQPYVPINKEESFDKRGINT